MQWRLVNCILLTALVEVSPCFTVNTLKTAGMEANGLFPLPGDALVGTDGYRHLDVKKFEEEPITMYRKNL